MTLSWAWPLALAGLAALLLPLLLHLDRRRSLQIVRFAALRWVGTQARPRRTWRVVEWLLLAVRLLLVAAAVAWLAHPWLRGIARDPVHWIAVVPGAADVPSGEAAEHAVWVATGFPPVTTPAPPAASGEPSERIAEGLEPASSSAPPVASVSSLLREFDARLAPHDTLEIRVPDTVAGLDAAAIDLSREVEWIVAGDTAPSEPPTPPKRLLALRYDSEANPSLRYVRAAVRAWQASPALAVQLDEGPADKPVPAGAAELRLDGTPLDPALVQSADYPRALHRSLFGDPPPPDRARAAHIAPTATAEPGTPPAQSMRRWLAWIAAGLFLLERVLANGRRLQARA